MTAMLFILFDIEVVFLIPWVLVFREFLRTIIILLPILFFLFVLILGFIYELKKVPLRGEVGFNAVPSMCTMLAISSSLNFSYSTYTL